MATRTKVKKRVKKLKMPRTLYVAVHENGDQFDSDNCAAMLLASCSTNDDEDDEHDDMDYVVVWEYKPVRKVRISRNSKVTITDA